MDLSPAIATTLAAMLGVPLFMALVRRIRALQHRPDSKKSFAQLAREYARWEVLAVLLSLPLAGAIAYLLRSALEAVYRLQLSSQQPGLFTAGLPSFIWWIPAMFLALFLAAVPLHYLYLILLGRERYAEYIEYGDQKMRIDTWKLFRYLGNLMIPLCLLSTFLLLDTYTRVTRDTIVINSFLGIGEIEYDFGQLQAIDLVQSFVAPDSEVVVANHYVIRFSDGGVFDFHKSPIEMDFQQQQELVRFLLENTGLEPGIESADAS